MAKYSINIGNLSPEENEAINQLANERKGTPITKEEFDLANQLGKSTVVNQQVTQIGPNNISITGNVSGLRIGDDLTEATLDDEYSNWG